MVSQLVQAARQGQATAWNMLYKQYYPAVYATALQLCPDASMASDAAQDAFITAYLKLDQLKDAAAFGGWMKTIITNHCYRLHRRQPRLTSLEAIPVESDGWWHDELNAMLDRLHINNTLHAAIAELPETLRTTLLLRYFSGFNNYENIASILSVPVGTVRSRLNQAKLKLSEQWTRFSDGGGEVSLAHEEWNAFYYSAFGEMHVNTSSRARMVNHLQKNVEVLLPDGGRSSGRKLFEGKVISDLQAGSWLTPTNVISSGNISIIEVKHFNSAEHPHHCPPRSALVLYRQKAEAFRISFHFSDH